MYCTDKIEIHLLKIVDIQLCIHSHKMLHKTKQNVALKNMEPQTMHHGTKMCKFKKKPKHNGECLQAFSFNRGGGEDSLSKPSSSSFYYYYHHHNDGSI